MTRRTKIVATIGPASDDPATLAAMIDAGMDVARVSLSHTTTDAAIELIGRIASVADESPRHVGILADLPGPKVRAASFGRADVEVVTGSTVRLESAVDGDASSAVRIAIDHPEAAPALRAGDRVVLGDGEIEMTVVDTDPDGADAEVISGGSTSGRPGVSIPVDRLRLESPTDDDLTSLRALCDSRADMVAVSFVTSASGIERAREVTGASGPALIAKIETAEAVADLEAIIGAADGLMVARGDLGIRCAFEEVPMMQKKIIAEGVMGGLPVITATQMLESMIHSPVPTRAEVADVTTAVIEGTSAVMLSGETAIGHDPVRVITTMDRITAHADAAFDSRDWGGRVLQTETALVSNRPIARRITGALSGAAWRAAIDAQATVIIACTSSGATARAITRFRPAAPVLAATPHVEVARELSVSWGIIPMVVPTEPTTDRTVAAAVAAARDRGWVSSGDVAAVLVGAPEVSEPVSDTLRLVWVE